MQTKPVSIVVPVFRNAHTLKELWQRLRRTLEADYNDFELLLVDDGSPDNSWDVIQELAAEDLRVKGIRLSRNFGQHPAIAAAFDRATGKTIILMDADLEDQPENIPEMLSKLGNGVDIVYTLKRGERGGLLTRLTSLAFHRTFSLITKVSIPGEVGTLRAFDRKVLEAIRTYHEYNVLFGPLMLFIGFSSVFMTVERSRRTDSKSGYTFIRRLSLASTTLASYTNLPHQMFFFTGLCILVFVVLYLLFVVFQVLAFGTQLPPGLTLIAFLLLFFIGITMLSLGVIGSYVFRVYQEVLRRPRYIVAGTTDSCAKTKEPLEKQSE